MKYAELRTPEAIGVILPDKYHIVGAEFDKRTEFERSSGAARPLGFVDGLRTEQPTLRDYFI